MHCALDVFVRYDRRGCEGVCAGGGGGGAGLTKGHESYCFLVNHWLNWPIPPPEARCPSIEMQELSMNGKWWSIVVLVAVAGVLLGGNSCGRDQQLVSIQIQPTVETFGSSTTPVIDNFGAQVQLRALGTYIHPPVTKDVTNKVTWSSNTPQMFTVDATGLLTATGESCGGTLVSATITTNTSAGGLSSSGAVVTGFMTANVVCFTSSGGGGTGSPVLTLTFAGLGAGIVASA